nr:MAG TPA: hypothetical protein [Caudoviricetes sp.]
MPLFRLFKAGGGASFRFIRTFYVCVAFLRRHRGRGVARSIGRWSLAASRACGLLGRPVGGACRR